MSRKKTGESPYALKIGFHKTVWRVPMYCWRSKASTFLGTLLLVAGLVGPVCVSGCSRKPPGRLSKKELKWITSTSNNPTSAQRQRLQKLTWKSWKKDPVFLTPLRTVLTHGAVDMETHMVTSSEYWYCPKARQKMKPSGHKPGTRPYFDAVWKHCGIFPVGLFTEAQFRRTPLVCRLVVELFDRLKRLGHGVKAARALAHAWVEPHPLLIRATAAKIKLPTSKGYISVPIQRGVWILRDQLHFGNKPITKLNAAARSPQRSAQPFPALVRALRSPKKASHTTLWADGRTPFGVIHRVLTTAGRAGLGCTHLMAIGALGEPTVVPVGCRMTFGLGNRRPRLPRRAENFDGTPITDLGLTLQLGPRGISVRSKHGSECPEPTRGPTCFGVATSYTPARLRPLLLHLWSLYSSKYKDCANFPSPDGCDLARHRLRVEVDPSVPYHDVVTLIEAIRGAPMGATDPPSPEAKRGCGFNFLRPGHGYQDAVAPFTLYFAGDNPHKRCMYSAPSLHLAIPRAK